MQTLPIEQWTLYDLEQQFGLQEVGDRSFFPEWQGGLPTLCPTEQERLVRVEAAYANLMLILKKLAGIVADASL